jgi:iron complex outermembrane receptor protein
MSNFNQLSGAIRFALLAGAASTFATVPAFAQEQEDDATVIDTVEVTGSRIKRADIEGALPVTVIGRAEIDTSGKVSVAELLQTSTFNSFGSTVPASGSSAQSFSELSLRGLGGGRTLILIDGRRAPVSPQTGIGQDLNTIPLAAVERIEILTDGASAIYGADAMGGVVNIITRRDFNGAEVTFGSGQSARGGDTEQGSALFGTADDKGRIIAGVSYNSRGITFARDLDWLGAGASSYSNNYYRFALDANGNRAPTSRIGPVPGGCTNTGFYLNGSGNTCLYDFNLVAADTASIDQKGLFARGDYQFTDAWSIYFSGNVTRVESFGRFAPTPEFIFLSAASPNNTTGQDVLLKHRFDALGPRDNHDDNQTYDFTLGFNWIATDTIEFDFGIRRNEARFLSHGYNYVNIPVAQQLFESGDYSVFDPNGNPEAVLQEMRATTSRDGFFTQDELFANMTADLFEMGGGTSAIAIGAEYRKEDYADIYDQQSAAGNVGGSSGNSSFGERTLRSLYGEWILPVTSQFEIDLAARYDDYSDFGNSTSPKVSFRYQPLDSLTLRASWGEGFRAPPLTIINALDAFSADTVVDPPTAAELGVAGNSAIQINGLAVATADLQPEESQQWSAGVVWDATDWLNLSLDYYNIEIENQIKFYSAQTVINRTNLGQFVPSNLGVTRDGSPPNGNGAIIQVRRGYANEGLVSTDGFDFSARGHWDFGDWGNLRSNLAVSFVNSYEEENTVGTTEFVGTSDVPEWRMSWQNVWEIGDFSLAYTLNGFDYTPESLVDQLHDNYGYSCAETVAIGYAGECSGDNWTHDLQFNYKAPWNATFTLGAINLTNEDPRVDLLGFSTGYNSTLYNAYGRQVYFRYTQSF